MCNAIKINSSAQLSGPATEALDQQVSKKRRLSCTLVEENPASNALSFEFDAMFNTVASSDCEAFPSIAWDFDDEADSHAISIQKLLSEETRMHGSGMLRSKSLKRDLSSLDVNSLNTSVSLASIDKIPLSPFNLGCKANCVPFFLKSATSGSSRSTLSHCGVSLRTSRSVTSFLA
jgi:hypothetical protein